MKFLLGAIALLIAAPVSAQAAPAPDPHAQHQQGGDHGTMDHSKMDHSKLDHSKMDCCKDGKHDCCKDKATAAAKDCCDKAKAKASASADHAGHDH